MQSFGVVRKVGPVFNRTIPMKSGSTGISVLKKIVCPQKAKS